MSLPQERIFKGYFISLGSSLWVIQSTDNWESDNINKHILEYVSGICRISVKKKEFRLKYNMVP